MVATQKSLSMLTAMAPIAPEQVSIQFLTGEVASSRLVATTGPRLTILQLWIAIKAIRYAYPAFVFLYFVLALTITVCTLQTQRLRIKDEHVRRNVILGLIFGVTLGYVSPLCLARFDEASIGSNSRLAGLY